MSSSKETTWAGPLPKHWEAVKSKVLFRNARDRKLDSDEQLSATQKYGVIPQRLFMEHEDTRVMLALSGTESFKHVDQDDFVISLRSFEGGIERCFHTGCVSPAYTVMKPNMDICAGYFQYLLKSKPFIREMQLGVYGIRDGKAVSFDDVARIALPLPPLDEQTAIAAYLADEIARIDSLIQQKMALAKLLDEMRRATISSAVSGSDAAHKKQTGIAEFPLVPSHWDVSALKRFVEVTDCKHVTVPFLETGMPVASIREIRAGVVDLSSAKRTDPDSWQFLREGRAPQRGDLLFVRNASVGAVGLVTSEEPFAMGQDVCLISDAPDGKYLWYVLSSDPVQSQLESLLQGSTIRRVNVEQIRNFIVCWPPKSEQQEIAHRLDVDCGRINELSGHVQREVALLHELRSATITDAVLGRIDVRRHAGR